MLVEGHEQILGVDLSVREMDRWQIDMVLLRINTSTFLSTLPASLLVEFMKVYEWPYAYKTLKRIWPSDQHTQTHTSS